MRLAHCGRVWVRPGAFRRVAEIAAGPAVIGVAPAPHCPCRVRHCVFRQPLRGLLLRAAYGQGHIEHDWRVCWPMKDRYAGDPALCAKRVRRSTALMAARSRRRGYFPLPRTAADICVRTVRKGPAIRFQVAAVDGPGRTIHCVRLPSTAGNSLEHKGLSLARTMRTVRTVSPRHLLAHW